MYIIYIYNNNPSVLDKYNSSSFFVKGKEKVIIRTTLVQTWEYNGIDFSL